MSEAMSRLEGRHLVSIPEDRESGGGNTMHDKIGFDGRETKILKSTLEEVPIDIIKSFHFVVLFIYVYYSHFVVSENITKCN